MDGESLLRGFENASLRPDEFHHREHIKVAYLLLRQFPFEHAMARMRAGLRALNSAYDVPDSSDRGYHETKTQSWMLLVDFTIREYGPADDADQFFKSHPELAHPNTLRLFYSQGRLLSAEAKAEYLPPDLHPLTLAWPVDSWIDSGSGLPSVFQSVEMRWVIAAILLVVVVPIVGVVGRGLGSLLIGFVFLALIGLPIFIAASAIAGRRSNAGWTSRQGRNIATGVYLFLIVVVGLASRLLQDSRTAGAFVPLGLVALFGMPVVVFVWLFTRQVRPRPTRRTETTAAEAVPHPLD